MLNIVRVIVGILIVCGLGMYLLGLGAALAYECSDLSQSYKLPEDQPLPLAPQKQCNGPGGGGVTVAFNFYLIASAAFVGLAMLVSTVALYIPRGSLD